MSRVDLGRITLNTKLDGPEGAPWLILSNSLGANQSMWDPQIAPLSEHFRILRYDTRGHGESDAPVGPYSFADLNGDVIALMDHFAIDRAAFMGLSMGGMTGLGLALDHPERITRLVCADARADAPPPFRQMWDERIAKVESGGLNAIVEGTLQSWFTADWLDLHPDLADGVRRMILGNSRDGYIACCGALQGLDYLRHVGRIECPVLYIGGDQDKGADPLVMSDMANRTPNGRYEAIANAAHVSNLNRPAAFNRIAGSFLVPEGA